MTLDTANLPTGPHLVDQLHEARGGVDFLNLRQVNLDLMAACVPGQNNVTSNIRSYSVMCWIYWKFFRENEQHGNMTTSTDDLRLFREKVESYFLWGHLLNDLGGVAGSRSRPPNGGRGRVSLKFSDWHRSADNTSIQAAVRYGPSLTELGLLEKNGPSVYHVTENGERLAKALDARLKNSPAYKTLADLSSHSGTKAEAQALFPCWRTDEASAQERQAMQSVLFDLKRIEDTRSSIGRRSAFIGSIVLVLKANRRPLNLKEIRDGVAYRRTAKGKPIELPEGYEEITHYWFVLQLRQLQRLALEAPMGWMEERLLNKGSTGMQDIIDAALASLATAFKISAVARLSELSRKCSRIIRSEADFFQAIDEDARRHDLQSVASGIVDKLSESMDGAFQESIRALCLLWNCASWLSLDVRYKDLLRRGGAARISLQYWFDTIARFQSASLREFVAYFFENLIFSQHLAVAANRFDGQTSRLRFAVGEAGIESLVDKPWQPGITFDHLEALLLLLVSCGVLEQDDQERFAVVAD